MSLQMVGKEDKMVTDQLLHGLHHVGAAWESARNSDLEIPTNCIAIQGYTFDEI